MALTLMESQNREGQLQSTTPQSTRWSNLADDNQEEITEQECNIDDVYKTMDEINEQTENMKQIQNALSPSIGAAANFDEVLPFSTELEELEGIELDEQLLQLAITTPVASEYVPAGRQPTRPIAQKRTTKEEEFAVFYDCEEEFAALQ
ncbi:hypothetical protein IFM89_016504 [Coptis chinensis]|uniref:Uncharacterized protein n=1 Tax=Coptis chinensis TaxID=261450 RepID=A0A835LZP0_9MAGN|nr:hypothetical protein IFM89_016504 [Coptis chinensis]